MAAPAWFCEPVDLAYPGWTRPPLNMNQRLHWATERRLKRQVKDLTCWLAKAARLGPYERIAVELHWQPAVRRSRDGDNQYSTIKAAVDGLVLAGVVPQDTTDRVEHRGLVLHEVAKPARVWLRVVPLPPL